MIRCCVFDLDGTLLNTTYALQRSMNLTLAEFGLGEISLAQVKKYVGNAQVKYIKHERNKNGSAARNTGFRASVGEYINFLDDDDEFLS